MHKHIRNIAATIAILLCSTPVYAAQKSRATLQSDITTNLASNKPITAADLRAALADIADSAYIILTDTSVLTTTNTATLTNKTISGASNTISNLPSSVIVSGTFTGARGGTNNAFFEVAGPASSTKTFTFPNASTTVLTTNAAVTVAQGGTGVATLTGIVKGNGTSNFSAATAGTDYYAPGSTDVAVADGGTGASTKAAAITNLGLNQEYCYALSDQATDLTTGTAKVTAYLPAAATVTAVRSYVNTAPTGSTIIVDINEAGTTIMSATKLSIDASEKTSGTAASAAVISDSSIAANAEITFDIDQVGSTIKGKGLVACISVTY